MRELLDNKQNLNQYIDELYSQEYKQGDLNEKTIGVRRYVVRI